VHADRPLRLTSVMGIARALLSTFEPHEAVEVLVADLGRDRTLQALLLQGDDAEQALMLSLEELLLQPLRAGLTDVGWSARP